MSSVTLQRRKLLRWFPKPDKRPTVKNLLLLYNITNNHWITIDVKLGSGQRGRDTMLFFDSMQSAEHPLRRHATFLRDFNTLLDMTVRELPG
jgi:hypothetical protein